MAVAPDHGTLDELCVNTIRTLSMDAVQAANSGHPGTPMALAPVAYTLFTRVMEHAPEDPTWPDRDRFVLSAGHASMLLYSTLHLTGYGVSLEDIKNFRQLHSPAAGHPEYNHAPGIETTTGPLGQGISTAVGMALAERMLAARFNRDGHEIVDHYTYVIASDGDLQEGVSNEASSLAGHLGLGRLIAFWDDNHITIEGETELAFTEDVGKRYEALGWHVENLGEDIALDRLERALADAKSVTDKPSLIVIRTHIAQGAPNKQDTHGAHGAPLGEEEIRLTKQVYGWPSEEPFFIPDEALEHFRRCVDRGRELQSRWQERFDAYRGEHPELADQFEALWKGDPPAGWDGDIPTKDPGQSVATRKASSEALNWVARNVPALVGGSADLSPSNLTNIDGAESVQAGAYGGRILHFGIREHGMAAIINGMVLHGFRAFGATFLIFSDYQRAAVRLSALMKIPSIWVYTHDSIGLGEDGPTHQPIEHLASLRAIPNLSVVRPADYNETQLAWRFAINNTGCPTALVFSRQGARTLDPATVPQDAIERGAYVLRDSDGEPDVILMGTGTEVQICLDAADALEGDGTKVRVVSAPCLDRFAEQDQAYRDSVLPPSVRARVAVEAASPMSWYRWIGEHGDAVAMEGYGASAPAGALYKHFGFTGEKVAERARAVLANVKETA